MTGMMISSDEIRGIWSKLVGSSVSVGSRESVGVILLVMQDVGQLSSSSVCGSSGGKSGCDRVRRWASGGGLL
jgi:hypothetical protein